MAAVAIVISGLKRSKSSFCASMYPDGRNLTGLKRSQMVCSPARDVQMLSVLDHMVHWNLYIEEGGNCVYLGRPGPKPVSFFRSNEMRKVAWPTIRMAWIGARRIHWVSADVVAWQRV